MENNNKKILEYERSLYSKGLLNNNLKDKKNYIKNASYINSIDDIQIKENEIEEINKIQNRKGKIKRRKSTNLSIK